MPLYEYRCTNCGERIEILQHVGEGPPRECPHCAGHRETVLSAPALQFKGSGWYVTDYGRSGGRSGDGKAAAEGAAKSSDKTAAPKGAQAGDAGAKR